MLCAHTVRRLKPGTFDQFREAFIPTEEEAPAGWVRFHLLRGLADEARSAGVDTAFGRNLERLAMVKAKYDPDNFFHVNNNIQPA